LGANVTLSSADIWQYNENYDLNRGVEDFAIYTSPTANINDATNFVGTFSLTISPPNSGEPVQRFPISVSNVRLVKLAIIDDFNNTVNLIDPDYDGLSEVRFEGHPCPLLLQHSELQEAQCRCLLNTARQMGLGLCYRAQT